MSEVISIRKGATLRLKSSATNLRKITWISLAAAVLLGVTTSCTIQKYTTINIIIMPKKSDKTTIKKTQLNTILTPFSHLNSVGEVNDKPSLTVQGDAYTIKELLDKHTQGIMPPVGLSPEYDYEEPTHEDDITMRKPDLDLTDIDNLSERVKTTQQKVEKNKKTAAAKAAKTDRSSAAKDEAIKGGSAADEPISES